MSINPVDHSATFDAMLPQKSAEPGAGGAEFAEALAKAQQDGGRIDAATAADILRLKVLASAVSLGSDGERQSSSGVNGIQGALDRFLANLAQEQGKGTQASDGDAPVEAGVAVIDADASAGGAGPGAALSGIIEKAARTYGVDRGLIRAVIRAESNFNPRAVSPAGAQGLMQLMPGTARSLGVRDSFDPEQNVMAGTRFLKDLLNRYGGDVDSALSAYNWGPGNFEKSNRLPRETREYLVKVKGYYSQYTA